MAQYISPEQRAKILVTVKDEGMSVPEAAKTFMVAEKTIRTWLRKQSRNGHTSSTELTKLQQENQELKAIIGEMIHHQRTKKKGPFFRS